MGKKTKQATNNDKQFDLSTLKTTNQVIVLSWKNINTKACPQCVSFMLVMSLLFYPMNR